jgi:hypothetical protein
MRALQCRDVDLVHAEHALHDPVCLHGIRIAHQLEELHRDDRMVHHAGNAF